MEKWKSWIDGVKTEVIAGKTDPDGLTEYTVNVKNQKPGISQVVIKMNINQGILEELRFRNISD